MSWTIARMMAVAVAMIVTVVAPSVTEAQSATVGILVTGQAPEADRQAVGAQLRSALSARGIEVVDPSALEAAWAFLSDEDGPTAESVGQLRQQLGAGRLLWVETRMLDATGRVAARMQVVGEHATSPAFASGALPAVVAQLAAAVAAADAGPAASPAASAHGPAAEDAASGDAATVPEPATNAATGTIAAANHSGTTTGAGAAEARPVAAATQPARRPAYAETRTPPGPSAIDTEVPPSGRPETRWHPNVGLLVAGAVVFPLTYVLGGVALEMFCAADGDCLPGVAGLGWVPFVGGFLATAAQDDGPWAPLQYAIATASTVLQLLGVVGIVVGLIGRRVPAEMAAAEPTLDLALTPLPGGGSVSLQGRY